MTISTKSMFPAIHSLSVMRARHFALPASVLVLAGCGAPPQPESVSPQPAPEPQRVVFVERAAELGLDFVHDPGVSGETHFPEIMGSGGALFDFDNDGDLDVYLIQGGSLLEAREMPNRLFVNQLVPTGELGFTDGTAGSGLGDTGYGMGVAAGDIDNDGDTDLYVTNVGPNALYRNNGDGTFSDITPAAERGDDAWSTSASFVDYDNDADLDLYVANYVSFSLANNISCTGHGGQRDFCDPMAFEPRGDRLWRNDGGGSFSDVTPGSGIDRSFGNGLGVTAADFDGNGLQDLYVANDKMANQLWIARPDGGFEDQALMSGNAYNADGVAEASMGLSAGDFDNDGDEDLFMTHLGAETNTLYRNDGRGSFVDVSDLTRLSVPSLGFTGFGAAWFDADHDGFLDLFSANGAVQIEPLQAGTDPYPYRQRNQIFFNVEGRHFVDGSKSAGEAMQMSEVSRGAAFGDIDNDGDVDVLVTNNNGPVRLLLNELGNGRPWLRLHLTGSDSNRDAIGVRVALTRGGEPVYWRRVHTDGSYLSASDRRLHFGVPDAAVLDGIRVQWPSGAVEEWPLKGLNREIALVEGSAP